MSTTAQADWNDRMEKALRRLLKVMERERPNHPDTKKLRRSLEHVAILKSYKGKIGDGVSS
jgi:hypothetical protein